MEDPLASRPSRPSRSSRSSSASNNDQAQDIPSALGLISSSTPNTKRTTKTARTAAINAVQEPESPEDVPLSARLPTFSVRLTKEELYPEEPEEPEIPPPSVPIYDSSDTCFICDKFLGRQHMFFKTVVFTLKDADVQQQIIDTAIQRNDELGQAVINRLRGASLEEKKFIYHKRCYDAFFIMPVPSQPDVTVEIDIDEIVNRVIKYIEDSQKFQFTISDLRKAMGANTLTNRVLFRKLKQKFGDDIYIPQHKGKQTIVYYKTFNMSSICKEWLCNDNTLTELEKKTALTVAAQILRGEINQHPCDFEHYPPTSIFLKNVLSDVPDLLTYFLNDLLFSENAENDEIDEENRVKRDNMSHSIVSMLRPRNFISSLQLAIGTYVFRKTGSKSVLELLSKVGASATYHAVQACEVAAILHPQTITSEDAFVQFVFDGTNHNVNNPDGSDAMLCLGGIAVYTPGDKIVIDGGPKKVSGKTPNASLIAQTKPIPILSYPNSAVSQDIAFVSTKTLNLGSTTTLPPTYVAYALGKAFEVPKLPLWKGFIESLSNDYTRTLSHIDCLPVINEPPHKTTTLYTSLMYAVEEARKKNQKTCFVTFDVVLYLKARSMVAELENRELNGVVLRLGGYHLLMYYLGAIGYVMEGSGIEEMWEIFYASDPRKKMLRGHDFTRGVRAHILTFTALAIIISRTVNTTNTMKEFIHNFFKNWATKPPSIAECNSEFMIRHMAEEFENKLNNIASNGPTAKLWIQYFKCITVALQFIEAERLGNWDLHVQSVEKMIPLFHAAGNFSYAKGSHVYVQDMARLKTIMDPVEFEKYTKEGYFTIRKTDKVWSGIWGDMVIEQSLNRTFSTDVKRGKLAPNSMSRYLLATQSACNIMECLENYCKIKPRDKDEYNDTVAVNLNKDEADIKKLLSWLDEHNPFQPRNTLVSIATGVVGGSRVNCHMAVEMGLQAMASIVGQDFNTVTLTNTYTVQSLITSSAENVGNASTSSTAVGVSTKCNDKKRESTPRHPKVVVREERMQEDLAEFVVVNGTEQHNMPVVHNEYQQVQQQAFDYNQGAHSYILNNPNYNFF